jgi:hypothetical protein
MNAQFQSWFAHGKAVEALCGHGIYFMPDMTYREEHDYLLAVSELLAWANAGNHESATRAFDAASATLLNSGYIEDALRLLRAYRILQKQTQNVLSIDENDIAKRYGRAAQEAATRIAQDKMLRNLLLSVAHDFPALQKEIGIK